MKFIDVFASLAKWRLRASKAPRKRIFGCEGDVVRGGPDDMRLYSCLWAIALVGALSAAAPSAAQTAPEAPASVAEQWRRYPDATQVQIRDAAALVRVTPEDRTDVAMSIVHRGPLPAPQVRISRNRLIVDGQMRRQIRSCHVDGQDFEVQTARQGRLHANQLPIIEIRVPRAAVVSAGGAVRLHMGPAESAEVSLNGCGDADLVRVENAADIAIAGAPDLRLYEAGTATVAVSGGGDVVLGVVRNGLTLSIAGAGDIVAARADGPTNIAVQGAGDVTIRDGRATTMSVVITGAGDVTHNGSAERLDVVILGGGDVRVRQVNGEVTRRVIGAGDVTVGR
jgi:hypothetical protein